jgi:hypothetical protein
MVEVYRRIGRYIKSIFNASVTRFITGHTGPNIFSTGPQRNIHGTIFYDVIALAHCTVVCDTGTIIQ